jgi:hypothetical protein
VVKLTFFFVTSLLLAGCFNQQPASFFDSDYCANTPVPLLPLPEHGTVHVEIEDQLYDHYQVWLDQDCDNVALAI